MGSLCSKSGTHSGGHTVLGYSDTTNPGVPSPSDPRAAAAEAAERRMKAVSSFAGRLLISKLLFRLRQEAQAHQILIKENLLHR
jgi:hypothetical protein